MFFIKRSHKKFVKQFESILQGIDEVILVRCDTLDKRVEKSIKSVLGEKGIIVKDLWYKEKGVGAMGIPIALRNYKNKHSDSFIAIAIRGKDDTPILYSIDKDGHLSKK